MESYIHTSVIPVYANTHTETSFTGCATTILREDARATIAKAVHCNDSDVVLFTGNGSTNAINDFTKMIEIDKKCKKSNSNDLPLVLTSGYEHHSNLLPWRDSAADVVQLGEAVGGGPDLAQLEALLLAAKAEGRPLLVGAFSAASNVTGILTDVDAVTLLLHAHGALALWDYASAAPYLPVQMNPRDADAARAALLAKDAIYFSPHKLAGG